MACTDADRSYFERLLVRLESVGMSPVVCVGAGEFLETLCPRARDAAGVLAGVIDDDERKLGRRWAGLPVLRVAEAAAVGARAAIITAEEPAQTALFERRGELLDAGMRVLCVPERFDAKPWDKWLIELFEHQWAAASGRDLPWTRAYPRPNHQPAPSFVEAVLSALPAGGVSCEIGPGEGALLERVAAPASHCYAVDFSARLLFDVIEFRMRSQRDALTLIHDETATLAGVPDASIDVLYSLDAFVHIPIDLTHQYLRAVRRVLKPSGCALIHFRAWEGDEPEHWEANHLSYARGQPSAMCYNSMESLRASCERVGLHVSPEPDALNSEWRGFVARFTVP